MRRTSWMAIAIAAAACAGGPRHPWSDQALCRAHADAPPAAADPQWIEILVQGFDRSTGLVTTPAIDCSGAQVKWEVPALSCIESSIAQALLPLRPLGKDDVAVSALDERTSIVWVMTNRFGSGDALGPVAVVERSGGELVVRTVGALRMFPTRAKLSLRKLGSGEVLMAEGERCASPDPASCERAVRLLPFSNGRFVGDVIRNDAGACLSPSLVHLTRLETESLDSGMRRQFELTSTLVFGPEALNVQELVLIRDSDPRQPAVPARLYRRAEDAFTIRLDGSRLVGSGAPLWPRMRAEGANARLR